MRRRFRSRLLSAGLAAALLSGCAGAAASSGHPSPAAAAVAGGRAHASAPRSTSLTTTTGRTGTGTSSIPAGSSTSATSPTTARIARPAPPHLEWKPKVAVTARVAPRCVRPGGAMRLVVTTKPKAAIAYQAVYSDNRGGAGAPFGAGYGGNDKGFADPTGRFISTWVVSRTAPAGWARVDVIVGYRGKWGYAGPTFRVGGGGAGRGC